MYKNHKELDSIVNLTKQGNFMLKPELFIS